MQTEPRFIVIRERSRQYAVADFSDRNRPYKAVMLFGNKDRAQFYADALNRRDNERAMVSA